MLIQDPGLGPGQQFGIGGGENISYGHLTERGAPIPRHRGGVLPQTVVGYDPSRPWKMACTPGRAISVYGDPTGAPGPGGTQHFERH
ncbi:MAG: hypothetical protein CM15mP74_00140 [Halieaceae bacterium]|nr:MAG: hypothetical protein CM15mP74_00140 [Halieaceae bacterium]